MAEILKTPRLWWLVAAACLSVVAAALVSQHVFDMQPCPWCVLQRLIFVAIAAMAVLAALWRSRVGAIATAVTVDLLACCGVAAALWQHFVAAASQSCNQTLADKILHGVELDSLLPEIFEPRASCADAAVSLAGVPYEFFSLGLFALISVLAVLTLTRSRQQA